VQARVDTALRHRAAKPLAFVLSLGPLAWWVYAIAADALGANPAEALLRGSGLWTLRFVCLLLLVTPLRLATGWTALARWRRMLGLYVAFYATLHALAYAWLDMGFDLAAITRDIPKRPFALVGFLAWLALLPLAATSFNAAIRALGAPRWQALHRLVYAIALLAVLHFLWVRGSKHRYGEVLLYGSLVATLLALRLPPLRAALQRLGQRLTQGRRTR
jgi:sulfoxide reductase heme-binding subunit YedZ